MDFLMGTYLNAIQGTLHATYRDIEANSEVVVTPFLNPDLSVLRLRIASEKSSWTTSNVKGVLWSTPTLLVKTCNSIIWINVDPRDTESMSGVKDLLTFADPLPANFAV